jgi:hypothetical protein
MQDAALMGANGWSIERSLTIFDNNSLCDPIFNLAARRMDTFAKTASAKAKQFPSAKRV